MRLRANGTLGPLYINKTQVIPIGKWLRSRSHPTPGFAVRPGWHTVPTPHAPHLSEEGRVWCKVRIDGVREVPRPHAQGGVWLLARRMKVVEVMR